MNNIVLRCASTLIATYHFRNVLRFRRKIGHWPRILFPKTYNEKMLWRKLFDHSPKIAQLSDKLLAKTYFKDTCPALDVVEPLWIGTRAEDIPGAILDDDVIIKTNHGCAFNIIVKDANLSRAQINKKVNGWLSQTYGQGSLEWGYGQISPKVFVEPMVRPHTDQTPFEFNFEVCKGRIISCYVIGAKASGASKIGIYDEDGNRLAVTVTSVPDPARYLPQDLAMPDAYLKAAKFARDLGADFDNVRVDFMCVDNILYGCEMSFYCLSGRGNIFSDPNLYNKLSDAWDLDNAWFPHSAPRGWRGRYAAALRASAHSK